MWGALLGLGTGALGNWLGNRSRNKAYDRYYNDVAWQRGLIDEQRVKAMMQAGQAWGQSQEFRDMMTDMLSKKDTSLGQLWGVAGPNQIAEMYNLSKSPVDAAKEGYSPEVLAALKGGAIDQNAGAMADAMRAAKLNAVRRGLNFTPGMAQVQLGAALNKASALRDIMLKNQEYALANRQRILAGMGSALGLGGDLYSRAAQAYDISPLIQGYGSAMNSWNNALNTATEAAVRMPTAQPNVNAQSTWGNILSAGGGAIAGGQLFPRLGGNEFGIDPRTVPDIGGIVNRP